MTQQGREGLLRRLGRALRGVNAIEYGRPTPTGAFDAPPGPVPALIVDDEGRADGAMTEDVKNAPDPASREFLDHQNTVEKVSPGTTADAPATEPGLIPTDPAPSSGGGDPDS